MVRAYLNEQGYGVEGEDKVLDLVSNPVGAFLPPKQAQAEKRFRVELQAKWNISFNRLYTFANVPLGRFKTWLIDSGNYESYMNRLIAGFNTCAIGGLMCRTLISVSWEGILYDCDFNLAAGLPYQGSRVKVSQMEGAPPAGTQIMVGEHCYTCTAGNGFT